MTAASTLRGTQNPQQIPPIVGLADGLHPRWQERPMHLKVQNGTAANSETNLCATCRLSTIVRGRSLDEEIVQCHARAMRTMRVTFKVTFCSAYSDARQPTYMQMLEHAWILQPGAKKRPAGFIRGADLQQEELAAIMVDIHQRDDF
jgi:hypothetical protein